MPGPWSKYTGSDPDPERRRGQRRGTETEGSPWSKYTDPRDSEAVSTPRPPASETTAVAVESASPPAEWRGRMAEPTPPAPMAADVTMVAPGAIDPARNNRTIPERYLEWRAEQVRDLEEDEVLRERGAPLDQDVISPRAPLASTPFGDIPVPDALVRAGSRVSNSRLGRLVAGASELVGLTGSEAGPVAAIAGDAPAGAAVAGGFLSRLARASDDLPATAASQSDVASRIIARERAAGVPVSGNPGTEEVARRLAAESPDMDRGRRRAEGLADAGEVLEQADEARGPERAAEAARLARARDLGFDVDAPLYHGTGADFDRFDAGRVGEFSGNEGHWGRGIYLSEDPAEAGTYAVRAQRRGQPGNVRPVYTRGRLLDLTAGEYDKGPFASFNFYRNMRELAPDDPTVQRVNRRLDDVAERVVVRENTQPNAAGEVPPYEALYHPDMTREEIERALAIVESGRPAREWTSGEEALVEKLNDARSAYLLDEGHAVPGIAGLYEDDVPVVPEFAIESFGRSRLSELAQRAGYERMRGGSEIVVFDPENIRSQFDPFDFPGSGGNRGGFAAPRLLEGLAGAGAGAAAGAALDDESPVRGATLGAAGGAAVGLGARPLARRLRSGESRRLGGVAAEVRDPPANRVGQEVGATGGGPGRLTHRRDSDDAATEAERFARAAAADLDEINPDEYANIGTFALDPAGEQRLREEVQKVVARHGLAPKETVPWEETRKGAARIAQSMGLDPDALKVRAGRLSGAEMLAIRNVVRTNTEQAAALSRRLTDPSLTAAERETAERTLSAIEAQNDALLSRFVRERSQTGRDLNNLKILARSSMDPVTWYTKAKRQLGDNPFTDEMRSEINRLINSGDRDGLARYVASLRKAKPGEKLTTFWKAGLLTSPTTHSANVLGNTTMAFLETAKDAPAAVFDRLLSFAFSTPRTKTFRAGSATGANLRGARKGLGEAAAVMRGAPLDDALRKYDYFREVNFENAFLDTYTKGVFRSLGAEDRVFRGMAMERSLAEQGYTRAVNEGLKGADAKARALELATNPTDEMTLQAIADAELATFTNRGALGGIISGAKQAARTKSDALSSTLDVIAPFTNTPANVATRMLEYSPLGAISTIPDIVRLVRKAVPESELSAVQRKVVDRLGRSSIGTAPIIAGWILASNGKMTAGYPSDQRTRGAWQLEGKQSNAILINGKWHSLERISPLGNLLVFGAHLHNVAENPELVGSERAVSALAGIGKTLTEQSFLRGVSDALNALEDPERGAASWAQSLAGSIVPTVVGRAARVGDPLVRDTEGAAERIQSRIPGLRRNLPARLDQFGEPIQADPSVWANIFDPFSSRADRTQDDPLLAEMARVGAGVTQQRRPSGIDRETWQTYQQHYGQQLRQDLERLVLSNDYLNATSDQERRELIEAAASRSRARVTRELKEQGLR